MFPHVFSDFFIQSLIKTILVMRKGSANRGASSLQ
jgi:hypothetical protein